MRKSLILVLSLVATFACGKDATVITGLPGAKGDAGSSGLNGHNTLVSLINSAPGCSNGGTTFVMGLDLNDDNNLDLLEVQQSSYVCNGSNGTNGINGTNGTNGSNGVDGINGTNGADGVNGTNGTDGINGTNGIDGTNGANGVDGQDGTDGVNGTNGTNGQDGAAAPASPFTPVALVDPCGDAPGIYDEVFIKMANGLLVASFSDTAAGHNTRFSILTPGSYTTTDGDNCTFTVSPGFIIINENHHY